MQPIRVLIVDDTPEVRLLLKGLLERANFQVWTAEDGPSALHRFREMRPGLVILDIRMPGMNGIEVARRIRQSSSVPILLLSAVGTPDLVAQAREAGVDAFLTKPVSPRALLTTIFELTHHNR
jgi:CheY-like chemotaxis protein